MATIQDICTKALRKIGVVSEDETANADQIANAVDAFNMMVHGWKLSGVDFTHTDQVATDTFSLGDEYQEGTIYLLASRLSPDYTIPPSFDADSWFRAFQANNTTITEATFDKALTYLPSRKIDSTYTSAT